MIKWIHSLLFFIPFAIFAQPSPTTDKEKAVDEKAQLIRKYFNTKQVDSIYALLSPDFQQKVSKQALEQGLLTQLAPYGAIVEYVFEYNRNGISKYKTKLFAGLLLQTIIGINDAGQISTMAMQPYKDEAAPKRTTLYTDNAMVTSIDSAIDKAARSYILDTITKGLSIAVFVQGKNYFYNYGEADKAKDVKANMNTVYEIGSITKTFVGYLLAMTVQQKKAKLTDAITKYLPDSLAKNEALQKIQLVHLANHSSGLPRLPADLFTTPGLEALDPYSHYTEAMLYTALLKVKPVKQPGEQYEYSNFAMGILATILSNIHNTSFIDLIDNYLVKIATLKITTASNNVMPLQAIGYNDKGAPTPYWRFQSLAGAGSIKSNATELLQYGRWQLAIMKGEKGISSLLTQPNYNNPPNFVTLGWHRNPLDQSPAIFQHGGGTYGFRSYLAVCPEQNWVVVALANHGADPGATGVGMAIEQYLKSIAKNP